MTVLDFIISLPISTYLLSSISQLFKNAFLFKETALDMENMKKCLKNYKAMLNKVSLLASETTQGTGIYMHYLGRDPGSIPALQGPM